MTEAALWINVYYIIGIDIYLYSVMCRYTNTQLGGTQNNKQNIFVFVNSSVGK